MKRVLCYLAASALVCGLVWSVTFTVSERDFAIVTRFGRVAKIVESPGLCFKLPLFLDRVTKLDKRVRILNTKVVQFLLGDKNPVILSSYVLWRIKNPNTFFIRLQTSAAAERKIEDMITSQTGSTLGEFVLNDILKASETEGASPSPDTGGTRLPEIEKRVRDASSSLAVEKYGIEILEVGISRLAYPGPVTEAVYGRMRAEREKEASKFRAEGEEEATKIRARTDKEVAEILSVAYEESETIKGEGEKEAMRTYSEAYGRNLEFFRFTKALEIYTKALKENSLLVFSSKSGIFSYLDDPWSTEWDDRGPAGLTSEKKMPGETGNPANVTPSTSRQEGRDQ